MDNYLDKTMFVIPSFNPDEKLGLYVNNLIDLGVKHILLINDGSDVNFNHVFDELGQLEEVTVLTHYINQGKGRALKTAFNYLLGIKNICRYNVVITEDDLQYTPEDSLMIAKRMSETNNFTLGERDFEDNNIPLRSRLGNKLTSRVFKLMFGKWINDTQTGLRGIPHYMLKECMHFEGERFDYEMRMLIGAVKFIPYEEVKISKKYYDENEGSNFRLFYDSWMIYKIMLETFLGFTITSLCSSIIDISLFVLLSKKILVNVGITNVLFVSTILARIISSTFNYKVNKSLIFKHHTSFRTIAKYIMLVIFIMVLSATLVHFLSEFVLIDSTLVKIFVDFCLYFVNYFLQKEFVFKHHFVKKDENKN